MTLSLVVGIGIVCFLLLYFAFNLDSKHNLLKFILIFFSLGLLILIPKGTIDESNHCEVVLDTQTDINTTAGFISGASCEITFGDTGTFSMTEDTASEWYVYNRTAGFSTSGSKQWNVTCTALDEDDLILIDYVRIY